jgi:hypothetical protein
VERRGAMTEQEVAQQRAAIKHIAVLLDVWCAETELAANATGVIGVHRIRFVRERVEDLLTLVK